jgi:hypothetical protein
MKNAVERSTIIPFRRQCEECLIGVEVRIAEGDRLGPLFCYRDLGEVHIERLIARRKTQGEVGVRQPVDLIGREAHGRGDGVRSRALEALH